MFPAKSSLEVRYGGAAHAQGGGRLFESGSKLGRQQQRLTPSQRIDRGGGGSGFLRPLDEQWVDPTWSGHAETMPELV